jgi:hypothetical protein
MAIVKLRIFRNGFYELTKLGIEYFATQISGQWVLLWYCDATAFLC